MQRRGFFGSIVVTLFSLPKIVERITADNPNNAAAPSVIVPTAWTTTNAVVPYTFTTYPPANNTGTAGLIWYNA